MNQQNRITVKFSEDKMRVFLALASGAPLSAVTILSDLLRYGVVHGLNTALIHKMAADSVFDKYVEVARGTPVSPPVDARIEILVDTSQGGRFSDFINVNENTPLARRIPPANGVDGMDVLGNVIKAQSAKDISLVAGEGTAVHPADPNLLISSRAGSFTHLYGGEVEVLPSRKIEGDVGPITGNISFPGDLIITGTVHSGFTVEAGGSLKILGDVQDAVVRCKGDLILRGGVFGESKAVISASRSVKAKSLLNVKLTASEDIFISEDVDNSRINTKGILRARSVAGGSVTAAGGITATRIGNKDGLSTILDVGALCNYEKEQENLISCIGAQNLMNDGCVSELYCYVRDNMNEYGVIGANNLPGFEELKDSLAESMEMRLEFEKNLADIEKLLKSVSDSMIVADHVYPNVTMRFGYTEHIVKEKASKVSVRTKEAVKDLAEWATV
ncbi:MAG: FapA family protein [Chitinispirillia bacterium]|nr:FapA family protein [Chitinispirillia bacterium]